MKHSATRTFLILFVIFLSLVLAVVLCLGAGLAYREQLPEETAPGTLPVTEPPSTEAPTTEPPVTEAPTTVPPTTEPPQPKRYLLSFAGDCTLGADHGKKTAKSLIGVVGEDYAYPFADVQDYFGTDEATFINLEGPLTDGGTPADKRFVFKGPAAFTQILTEGSVEFANVVNNHAFDYGKTGYRDTLDGLDKVGIPYAEEKKTVLFTTENGLTIGVYADRQPKNADGIPESIQQLRAEGAQVVICVFHWGKEYHYKPTADQQNVGRAAIDAGADIVYGHHPHVLQPIETYNGGVIFYSLGNFSFGGNSNPPDKDTAILQQEVIVDPDGTVRLGELKRIPCYVTGTKTKGNDYQPMPMEEGTEEYDRVLQKLAGTFPKDVLVVGYRDDIFPQN